MSSLVPAYHCMQYARTANKGMAKCLYIPFTTMKFATGETEKAISCSV